MTELKNCPFCGKPPVEIEPQMVDYKSKTWMDRVECISTGCVLSGDKFYLDDWNERATSPWFRVQDMVPESNIEMLVAMKPKTTHIKSKDIYSVSSHDGECWDITGEFSITHWMPIPAKPEGV